MATDKLQGTCSVCLRMMQLRGDHPIRHGFSAIGVRHGQSGGYHTGPCPGTQYPHLGISTEGTTWALARERGVLERLNEALDRLATNPDLTWYPKKYDVRGGRLDLSRKHVVKYGDEQQLMIDGGAPSYASLHRQEKAQLENHKDMAERAITEYERVLSSWSPEKYPTKGAPTKEATVHMEHRRKTVRGEIVGNLCRFSRRPTFSARTCDPKEVTCKRCRAQLGLPT